MTTRSTPTFEHPRLSRRTALQAGAVGLLGLGMSHLAALRAAGGTAHPPRAGACIFIFLSGGLSQIDSFDPKPDAPAGIRGQFKPIATRTPGVHVCEHLAMLAARSGRWALVRSLAHPSNDHSAGHHIMLTGRSQLPPGFDANAPKPTDWPSIAAVAGAATRRRNNLPPAVVLPEKPVHYSGRVIPGQFAGEMGARHEPWFIEASPYEPAAYGAYPQYEFDHQRRPYRPRRKAFVLPNLGLPEGLGRRQFGGRLDLLRHLDGQRRDLDRWADAAGFDRYHQGAVALLTDPRVRTALDIDRADARGQDRYGRNSFGWSLLMARRLVEAGVNLVQVNLGNNETWDTHGNAFPHLKDKLFPPTDRAVSALLDDLHDAGLLDSTLVVMAGEFGRTPKVSGLPQFYKLPGRDHWGAVQTVFLAGGGVRGGVVVGASDRTGGYPARDPQTPENLAATIYRALGIPATASWEDAVGRPHFIYHGRPIEGLC
jgi:uncharacterized protein (DUF1501 family)